MIIDETEEYRRELQGEINSLQASREILEKEVGQVWNTDELSVDFEVVSFLAPFVSVRRKSDSKEGTMMFQHSPRFYFSFQ